MSLLIHSMAELKDIILPALRIAGCRQIVEVGSEAGGMTAVLLDYCRENGGCLTTIEPSPSGETTALLSRTPYGLLHRDTSIRAIPMNPPSDAYLLDGDHNYFTVSAELLLIEKVLQRAGKPLLVFLHDVGWPWGHRDLYYDPETIPEEWVRPHTWERGITIAERGTIAGGFRGCGQWACAIEEGGERNGVLKAVEDFLLGREDVLRLVQIPAVFGLGVLYTREAEWAAELERMLTPYDQNSLLAKLEKNRLENYLRVIELQDAHRRSGGVAEVC